jgi:hypothetical protein
MEKVKKPEITAEQYESLLSLKLVDMTRKDLLNAVEVMAQFIVTPEYEIQITDRGHDHFFYRYGVDPDRTLTEGNIFKDDGKVKVSFKSRYQPIPGFQGTENEMKALQVAAKDKIISLFK